MIEIQNIITSNLDRILNSLCTLNSNLPRKELQLLELLNPLIGFYLIKSIATPQLSLNLEKLKINRWPSSVKEKI